MALYRDVDGEGAIPVSHMENNREFFELKYTAARVRAARRIEEAALGQVVGVNGYTTVVQAQRLCEHLGLEAGATLLDVGAGRGWPGSYIAETTGCRLVSADVPWEALLAAKLRRETDVVKACGESLPFRGDSFDAIVHTDVFC